MKKTTIIVLCTIALAVFTVWASDVMAYSTWSGGCQSCHGNFRTTYTSLHDGTSWGSNLHDVHRNTMLGGDCNACHTGSSRTPVYLNSANGGSGLSALGCSGCHGRTQDNVGSATSGAGLRQHHYVAGETVCAGCHSDSNPANYKPVSEKTAPPFYFTPDASHPNKPTSSCNQAPGKENYAASSVGLDNDGDGLYDADDPDCQAVVACTDTDGDGYGTNGAASCTKGTAVDCNDSNAAVNPGAVDITCNGVDENCSGAADEGYVPASTVCGKGLCASTGQLACQSGRTVDTCVAGTPQTEGPAGNATCSDSRDNDCDGTTDSLDSNCVAACTPTTEVCDGKDNDCDGRVDEGLPPSAPTTCGVGSCASTGTLSCVGGAMIDSCKAGTPQTEGPFGSPTCGDGLDNNCNGQTDVTDANCAQTCVPTTEVCDGKDNDCNGTTDDGIASTPTTCGVGVCASTGQSTCQSGRMVNTCTAGTPQTEGPSGSATCGDTQDNDCDGTTDAADASCTGTVPSTCVDTDGDGYGSNGASSCPNGTAIDCNDSRSSVNPGATEVCDGRDNNCNGQTDEGLTKTYYKDRDRDGYGNPSITKDSCRRSYGYVSNNADCNDSNWRIHPRAIETCGDGIDQNCNGNTDDVCAVNNDDDDDDESSSSGSGSTGGSTGGSTVDAAQVLGTTCLNCHGDKRSSVSCSNSKWPAHNGSRVSSSIFAAVSTYRTGSTCSTSSGGSTASGVPADHTDSEEGKRHKPGKDEPYDNGCTSCHGSNLRGAIGPSCYSCHGKEW